MLEEKILKISEKLDELINEIISKHNSIKDKLNFQDDFAYKINKIINNYSSNKTIDFMLLKECEQYLLRDNMSFNIEEYINLYEIREELSVNFPDKVASIDKKFENLIVILNSYLLSDAKEKEKLKLENKKYEEKLKKFKDLKVVINKIVNNKILSSKEIDLLDNISSFYDESIDDLYIFIIKNNYTLMNEKLEKERKKLKQIRLKKIRETKKYKRDKKDINTKATSVDTKKTHILTEKEKELLNIVKQIIEENDISDKTFLSMINGLSPIEILEYIDEYNDTKTNIALVLNDIIIEDINQGKIYNIEEILEKYIEKYNYEKTKNNIPLKLDSIGRNDILDDINEAYRLLEIDKNSEFYFSYQGYLSNLETLLEDLIFGIIDDEIFSSGEYIDLYTYFKNVLEQVQLLYDEYYQNDEVLDNIDDTENFYSDANNLIVFLDGIDFSEQIDSSDALTFTSKRKILNGLKNLSLDNNILVSSNHVVKDYKTDKYKSLRSFRGSDYRIVYKVSRATGLEKVFKRPMNVIFAINVGYRPISDKSDFYNESKKIYDNVKNNIDEVIKILNSDNIEEIQKIVNEQFYKMKLYINSCNKNVLKSTKGGA